MNKSFQRWNSNNSVTMDRQESSCPDHEATQQALKNEPQGSKELKKRKLPDETDDHQNKRSCTRTSASTSNENTTDDANHLETKRNSKHSESSSNQFKQLYPRKLMTLMYQVELSILCLHRKMTTTSNNTNFTNSGIFKNSKVGQFNNIILQFDGEYFCIKVDYFETRGYDFKSLFTFGEQSLSCYLKEFTLELMFYLERVTDMPKYLIFYTNFPLNLTNDVKLKQNDSSDCIQMKTLTSESNSNSDLFRLLQSNQGEFYQFSTDDETREKLSNLVQLPKNIKNQINRQGFCEGNIRKQFFDRLIFAVNQPSIEGLVSEVQREMSDVTNYQKIREEIMIQLIEDQENDTTQNGNLLLTKELVKTLLSVNPENKLDENKPTKSTERGIKFAQQVTYSKDAGKFNAFVKFLAQGKGKECLDTLEKNEIDIIDVANIIRKLPIEKAEFYFLRFYGLLFDFKGRKTKYLENFESHEFSVNNMSEILSNTGDKSAKLLFDLYKLWFDDLGNPSIYVKTLKREGINLSEVSILLTEAKFSCVDKFLSIFTTWFRQNGDKTMSLVTLEKHGLTLPVICDVLHKSGTSYTNLYRCWFDEKHEKKCYLQNLEEVGIDLKKICSVIKGAEKKMVVTAFKELYSLWFTDKGEKSFYLKTLERENISLSTIFDILIATGNEVGNVFRNLFCKWFDERGEKTELLKTLEAKGRPLTVITKLLSGEGYRGAEKFTALFDSLNNVESSIDRQIRIKTEITQDDDQFTENREEKPLIKKIKVEENENTTDIVIKTEV